MAAMKRMEVSNIERNRARFAKLDALEREEIISAAVEAALTKLDKHFPGATCGGISDSMAGELQTFIEGMLERRFEN